MTHFQKLSDTEMEVMQIIWASDHPMTSSELLNIFKVNKGVEWKGQTMATFLARLVDKGVLISVKQQGRTKFYEPSMSPQKYHSQEAKSLLKKLYEGSVKNFLTALYDGKEMSREDITELKHWFAEKADIDHE